MYVRDTRTGATTLESVGVDGGPGDGHSVEASLSGDGRWLAFTSDATNLVEGDTNGKLDVFLRDRQSGRTVLVSVARDGGPSDDGSDVAAVSDDGRHVAFFSGVTNLVAGDTNGVEDVFVRDRVAGATIRASVRTDGKQAQGGDSGDY